MTRFRCPREYFRGADCALFNESITPGNLDCSYTLPLSPLPRRGIFRCLGDRSAAAKAFPRHRSSFTHQCFLPPIRDAFPSGQPQLGEDSQGTSPTSREMSSSIRAIPPCSFLFFFGVSGGPLVCEHVPCACARYRPHLCVPPPSGASNFLCSRSSNPSAETYRARITSSHWGRLTPCGHLIAPLTLAKGT